MGTLKERQPQKMEHRRSRTDMIADIVTSAENQVTFSILKMIPVWIDEHFPGDLNVETCTSINSKISEAINNCLSKIHLNMISSKTTIDEIKLSVQNYQVNLANIGITQPKHLNDRQRIEESLREAPFQDSTKKKYVRALNKLNYDFNLKMDPFEYKSSKKQSAIKRIFAWNDLETILGDMWSSEVEGVRHICLDIYILLVGCLRSTDWRDYEKRLIEALEAKKDELEFVTQNKTGAAISIKLPKQLYNLLTKTKTDTDQADYEYDSWKGFHPRTYEIMERFKSFTGGTGYSLKHTFLTAASYFEKAMGTALNRDFTIGFTGHKQRASLNRYIKSQDVKTAHAVAATVEFKKLPYHTEKQLHILEDAVHTWTLDPIFLSKLEDFVRSGRKRVQKKKIEVVHNQGNQLKKKRISKHFIRNRKENIGQHQQQNMIDEAKELGQMQAEKEKKEEKEEKKQMEEEEKEKEEKEDKEEEKEEEKEKEEEEKEEEKEEKKETEKIEEREKNPPKENEMMVQLVKNPIDHPVRKQRSASRSRDSKNKNTPPKTDESYRKKQAMIFSPPTSKKLKEETHSITTVKKSSQIFLKYAQYKEDNAQKDDRSSKQKIKTFELVEEVNQMLEEKEEQNRVRCILERPLKMHVQGSGPLKNKEGTITFSALTSKTLMKEINDIAIIKEPSATFLKAARNNQQNFLMWVKRCGICSHPVFEHCGKGKQQAAFCHGCETAFHQQCRASTKQCLCSSKDTAEKCTIEFSIALLDSQTLALIKPSKQRIFRKEEVDRSEMKQKLMEVLLENKQIIKQRGSYCNRNVYYEGYEPNLVVNININSLKQADLDILNRWRREDYMTPLQIKKAAGYGEGQYGVFSCSAIEKDEFLCEYCCDVVPALNITMNEYRFRHTFGVDGQHEYDLSPQKHWSIANYINYAPKANKDTANAKTWRMLSPQGIVIVLIANRRIEEGEEILYDYNGVDQDAFPTENLIT